LYAVKIKTNCGDLIFKCSLKIIPFSLEKFYPDLTTNQKLFFPYTKLNKEINLTETTKNFDKINTKYHHMNLDEYLEVYSKNDCLVLKEGLTAFFKILNEVGMTNITKYNSISSIALNFFIKKYNTIDLKLPKSIKNDIRASYFGGRCEVFGNKIKNEKILFFDYPGMYQNCMLQKIPKGP
jgi:hypothetical protein